ncbi:hypothetical protein J6590_031248 [Homalodisca vitripennis]|nr:hypothetical protein J6590_031248 [Homalodisca vitripennis]
MIIHTDTGSSSGTLSCRRQTRSAQQLRHHPSGQDLIPRHNKVHLDTSAGLRPTMIIHTDTARSRGTLSCRRQTRSAQQLRHHPSGQDLIPRHNKVNLDVRHLLGYGQL